MQAKGLASCLALSLVLVSGARAAGFTPLTDPGNPVLQEVGKQLDLSFGSVIYVPKAYIAEFFITNYGPIPSVVDAIYMDDSRSQLFTGAESPFNGGPTNFAVNPQPGTLPGGGTGRFVVSHELDAVPPAADNGINQGGGRDVGGEVLFLWATLRDQIWDGYVVENALQGIHAPPLRFALHVSNIAGYQNGGDATFLYGQASPVPEAGTGHLLAAGLGLLAALGRQRRRNT